MASERKQKQQRMILLMAVVMVLVLVSTSVAVFHLLLSDDSQKKKRHVQMVTLMKPPPPPKIKEKPPEPEVEKKQEIVEPEEKEPEPEPEQDQAQDEPPPGNDLGLDAEGSGDGDGFGLVGKKGGRSLIGGQYSKSALMMKYAWYTRIIQEELRKKMNEYFESNGGIPDGNLKALVQMTLDDNGKILSFEIKNPSGDDHLDRAVTASLKTARISEPPPQDMPRTLKLKISAKG